MSKPKFEKKDKFDDLPEGFAEAMESMDVVDIKKKISEVALLDCTERDLLKEDPDVNDIKEQLKNLMEPYRENFKSYKLQIQFCKQLLESRGVNAAIASANEKSSALRS